MTSVEGRLNFLYWVRNWDLDAGAEIMSSKRCTQFWVEFGSRIGFQLGALKH